MIFAVVRRAERICRLDGLPGVVNDFSHFSSWTCKILDGSSISNARFCCFCLFFCTSLWIENLFFRTLEYLKLGLEKCNSSLRSAFLRNFSKCRFLYVACCRSFPVAASFKLSSLNCLYFYVSVTPSSHFSFLLKENELLGPLEPRCLQVNNISILQRASRWRDLASGKTNGKGVCWIFDVGGEQCHVQRAAF